MNNHEASIAVASLINEGHMDEKQLEMIKDAGINNIELCAVRHHFDYCDLNYLNRMIKFIQQHNINVPSMHLPFGHNYDLSSSNNNIRNSAVTEIHKCVKIAQQLKTNVLVLHPGTQVIPGNKISDLIDRVVHSIREILTIVPENIKIAVENMLPGCLACSIEDLVDIVEKVNDSRVGYCLDTGHANMNNNLLELISTCGPDILNIHIHDNSGHYDLHLMPSEGTIDWQKTYHELQNNGFCGLITYEVLSPPNPEFTLRSIQDNYNWICNQDRSSEKK